MDLMLYHGSQHAVPHPDISKCRPNNDYGQGFYCTVEKDLACEWACQKGHDGFVNSYEIDLSGLNIIDLNESNYSILHWLEVLFTNRAVRLSTPVMKRGADWLKDNFAVDLTDADLIHGYRADDSYFGFARAFLRNEITLGQLSRTMKLGKLGMQYMIKSPIAFERLHFIGSEPVEASQYWPLRSEREAKAQNDFERIVSEDVNERTEANDLNDYYLSDLMSVNKKELYGRLF